MTRAVFLDRDGVINRAIVRGGRPYAPSRPEEFELLPGVADALHALRAAGYLLIVVTNQPDVARGTARRDDIDAMHARLRAELPIDDVCVCFHDDHDSCACRKPAPGLLYAAAVTRNIALSQSVLVGDRWRDIGAGRAAGCTTVLICGVHNEPIRDLPDATADDLPAAAAWILSNLSH